MIGTLYWIEPLPICLIIQVQYYFSIYTLPLDLSKLLIWLTYCLIASKDPHYIDYQTAVIFHIVLSTYATSPRKNVNVYRRIHWYAERLSSGHFSPKFSVALFESGWSRDFRKGSPLGTFDHSPILLHPYTPVQSTLYSRHAINSTLTIHTI